jgi:hypothetical protein
MMPKAHRVAAWARHDERGFRSAVIHLVLVVRTTIGERAWDVQQDVATE